MSWPWGPGPGLLKEVDRRGFPLAALLLLLLLIGADTLIILFVSSLALPLIFTRQMFTSSNPGGQDITRLIVQRHGTAPC